MTSAAGLSQTSIDTNEINGVDMLDTNLSDLPKTNSKC